MQKRILIYGAGVIGSLYGGMMAKSGCIVSLLARGKRLEELRKNGLLLKSLSGVLPEKVDVEILDSYQGNDFYDYVFVTLRNEQVEQALEYLAQINTDSFVFMVNNCLGYEKWIDALGAERVLPAFPGSGGKIENGIVIYEIVSKFIQPTTLGELSGRTSDRLSELRSLLLKSGFGVSIEKNMDKWQKSHVAMVAPLGNAIYYDGGNNYTLSGNKEAIRQMSRALKENFIFLKKSGIGIAPNKLRIFLLLPISVLSIIMRLIYKTKWAETVISNHSLNAREEMRKLSKDFLQLANFHGYDLNEFRKLSANNQA